MEQTLSEDEEKKSKFGKEYFFSLRQHNRGPFRGLWELNVIAIPRFFKTKKVLTDADALNFCLENLQGEIEADGF